MRKLLLSFSLLLGSLLCRAQIDKGSVLIGGDLGVFSTSDKSSGNTINSSKSTGTTLNLNPSIGLAVQNNLVAGINLGFGYLTGNNQKQRTYDFGVFMRKYKTLTGHLYFFGEAAISFQYIDYVMTDASGSPSRQDVKASGVNIGFSPGLGYGLTRRWQLEIIFPSVIYLQYTHSETNTTFPIQGGMPMQNRDVNDNFSFNTNLANNFQLAVGLRYLIGK